ncbi:outer dynein arm-docking complex subunit 4 isoform X2 [Syngnathus typhle]|uniref:outer dynein arm-docking complex subunit 4 isoform X2 n=1 Tax=Syngnathus typhle TaxID=161592 RepID=UPI002A69EF78|nr:outer dynein arm-docking complex subunit 4 isoform X2 [Syngnathus typhle]
MSETESECRDPKAKGVFSTLMADGDWLLLKGECEKAVESYSTALTLKPEDKDCFVGRSKCYLKMGQYEKALRDAEASLQEDHSFFEVCVFDITLNNCVEQMIQLLFFYFNEGLYQKAEALYCLGEFEFALVFYHQGLKLRPQVHEFRLGIQKAHEAIENAVTVPPAVIQKVKADMLQKDVEMTAAKKPHASETEKKSKKYLGEFYEDRKYLENLLKDEALVKSKTRNGKQLQDVIQGCLAYLDDCADFWNQQKPPRVLHPKTLKDNQASRPKRLPVPPRKPHM